MTGFERWVRTNVFGQRLAWKDLSQEQKENFRELAEAFRSVNMKRKMQLEMEAKEREEADRYRAFVTATAPLADVP